MYLSVIARLPVIVLSSIQNGCTNAVFHSLQNSLVLLILLNDFVRNQFLIFGNQPFSKSQSVLHAHPHTLFLYFFHTQCNVSSLSYWHVSINVNKNLTDATVCRYLFTAKSLYMFRVSQHPSSGVLKTVPAASGTGHNTGADTSLQHGLIRPRWREVAVPILWPVPEAAGTIFSTPDDGCCDTQNM